MIARERDFFFSFKNKNVTYKENNVLFVFATFGKLSFQLQNINLRRNLWTKQFSIFFFPEPEIIYSHTHK